MSYAKSDVEALKAKLEYVKHVTRGMESYVLKDKDGSPLPIVLWPYHNEEALRGLELVLDRMPSGTTVGEWMPEEVETLEATRILSVDFEEKRKISLIISKLQNIGPMLGASSDELSAAFRRGVDRGVSSKIKLRRESAT